MKLHDFINELKQFEKDHPEVEEVEVYGINSHGAADQTDPAFFLATIVHGEPILTLSADIDTYVNNMLRWEAWMNGHAHRIYRYTRIKMEREDD